RGPHKRRLERLSAPPTARRRSRSARQPSSPRSPSTRSAGSGPPRTSPRRSSPSLRTRRHRSAPPVRSPGERRLAGRPAAVDGEDDTGDRAGLGTGEEDDGGGDLIRVEQPP